MKYFGQSFAVLLAAAVLFGCSNEEVAPVQNPAITGLSVQAASWGQSVTISGQNLSVNNQAPTVTFNGTQGTVTAFNPGSVTVTVPPGASSGPLAVNNGVGTTSFPFTVFQEFPFFNTIPSVALKGTTVTVTGGGFKYGTTNPTVKLKGVSGGVEATVTLTSATSTQLVFQVPGTLASNFYFIEVNNGFTTGISNTFEIKGPMSITGMSATSGAYGTRITLTCSELSLNDFQHTLTFDSDATSEDFPIDERILSYDPDEVTFILPRVPAGSGKFKITNNNFNFTETVLSPSFSPQNPLPAGLEFYYKNFDDKILKYSVDNATAPESVLYTLPFNVNGQFIVGLTIDKSNSRFFYINLANNVGELYRVNLNGTGATTLYGPSVGDPELWMFNPTSVGYNPTSGKIYLTDYDGPNYNYTTPNARVAEIDVTNGDRTTLANSAGRFPSNSIGYGPSFTITDGTYYYGVDATTIRRNRLDGTGAENPIPALVSSAVANSPIQSLALSTVSGKLYWFESDCQFCGSGSLRRANLDGTGVETVLSNQSAFSFLEVIPDAAGDRLIWYDFNTGRIRYFQVGVSDGAAVLATVANSSFCFDISF